MTLICYSLCGLKKRANFAAAFFIPICAGCRLGMVIIMMKKVIIWVYRHVNSCILAMILFVIYLDMYGYYGANVDFMSNLALGIGIFFVVYAIENLKSVKIPKAVIDAIDTLSKKEEYNEENEEDTATEEDILKDLEEFAQSSDEEVEKASIATSPNNSLAKSNSKVCIHCGKPLQDGAKFCMYCGKSQEAQESD